SSVDKPLAHRRAEEFLENTSSWDQLAQPACILFADLVGSTEFKRDHPPPEGLAKTLLHNMIISNRVFHFKGSIVKYLGDGVMGIFVGENRANRALMAGLAAI